MISRGGWYTRVLITAVTAGLIQLSLCLCVAASAGAQTSGPNVAGLQPRIAGLQSRVVGLQARVIGLQPRAASVAPKQTSSNSFTVNADVLFAFDSSDLSPDAQVVLASVVHRLDTSQRGAVAIVGYTDSIGTPGYNIGLSQRRAAAVQAYLTAHVTNPGLRYTSQGLGEADPVAPNTLPNGQDNPAGRQQNRRVVITYRSG